MRVGEVTSVAGGTALGLVKHTIEPGDEIEAGDTRVRVTG
jgi:predicted deacylase